MLPAVEITKVDGQTGVVRPAATGIAAVIAAAESGPLNSAGAFNRRDVLQTDHGLGHLTEFGAYILAVAKKPIVGVRADPSTDGAYSAITHAGGGTSAITAGATAPTDEFPIIVKFTVGATIGVSGAKYKYSINGGQTFSKELALGTANTIAIPNTGAELAFGSGTVVAGETASFTTTGPKITNTDLPASLEALRVTSSAFEAVLVDMEADIDTVTTCALWIEEMNLAGKFPTVVLTVRPRGSAETEAAYKTALEAMIAAAVSVDIVLCADVGDVTSAIRGITFARPTGLFGMARGMKITVGTDAAFVETGPLDGVRITDSRNNPKYHDEAKYPGLDDLRLTTLRTIEGREGVYLTNANLLSQEGSDFVYWQHARTLNAGCVIAHQLLTGKLSKGVQKAPTPGPNGERYIAEGEAQNLEALVDAELDRQLVTPRQVDDMACILTRTDDIRSNAGAVIGVSIESVSLAYAKKFNVRAGYVTAIERPSAAQ